MYSYNGVLYTQSEHPLYRTWYGMIRRCGLKGKTSRGHEAYLRKGITVCKEWLNFQTFIDDMGIRPDGHTLERVDNSKGYCKSNCEWATIDVQALNKDDIVKVYYEGEVVPLIELSRRFGIDRKVLHNRVVCLGWPLERALTQPIGKSRKKKCH